MEDELEVLEFQFPSMYALGTYVRVVQVLSMGMRAVVRGETGIVHSHHTRRGQRVHRVNLDNGNTYDFLTQELQKDV